MKRLLKYYWKIHTDNWQINKNVKVQNKVQSTPEWTKLTTVEQKAADCRQIISVFFLFLCNVFAALGGGSTTARVRPSTGNVAIETNILQDSRVFCHDHDTEIAENLSSKNGLIGVVCCCVSKTYSFEFSDPQAEKLLSIKWLRLLYSKVHLYCGRHTRLTQV